MDMILSEEQAILYKTALEFAQQALTAQQIELLALDCTTSNGRFFVSGLVFVFIMFNSLLFGKYY